MSNYRVNLDIFAGPLDLLLYLVRKEEVDIYDISISRITDQYIGYIEMLRELDIDIDLAGDFLVMAATLMQIKSAMLLPKDDPEHAGEEEYIDSRSELIRQLLEYKKFKDAANLLDAASDENQQRYPRSSSIIRQLKPDSEPEVDLDQVNIWDLLEAFDRIMKATGSYQDYRLIKDDTPIDLYQIEILHRLQSEGAMSFSRIFEGRSNRAVMIGLFLGLLELIREKLVWVEQPEPEGTIFVKALTEETPETAVHNAMMSDKDEDRLEREASAAEMEGTEQITIAQEPIAEEEAFDTDEVKDEEFDIDELSAASEPEHNIADQILIVELPAKKDSHPQAETTAVDNRNTDQIPIVELVPDKSKAAAKEYNQTRAADRDKD
ncbi:MAG: chromosome segregation protein ScpA [Candidatus Brocadiia bacterium]|nr:MAG: chromosome segregation protein ScpA [Candidatus Brocadiia bacterium]